MMMYNIKTGYGGIGRCLNSDIVILVTRLRRLAESGVSVVFTDRHAYLRTARFFSSMDDLDEIDWALLQDRDFKRHPDDPEKTERYQAEALIHRYLPVERLAGIVCHGEKEMKELERNLRVAHVEAQGCRSTRLLLLMIRLGQGNLLEAKVEAVVNTVNTVGIMGKGIALMFKERFSCEFRCIRSWLEERRARNRQDVRYAE